MVNAVGPDGRRATQYDPPMTITLKQLLILLGGVLLVIGLVLGLTPISHDGGPCGSAFISSDDTSRESLDRSMSIGGDWRAFEAGCTDAVSSRRTIALALTIPGALLLVGAYVVGPLTDRKPADRKPNA